MVLVGALLLGCLLPVVDVSPPRAVATEASCTFESSTWPGVMAKDVDYHDEKIYVAISSGNMNAPPSHSLKISSDGGSTWSEKTASTGTYTSATNVHIGPVGKIYLGQPWPGSSSTTTSISSDGGNSWSQISQYATQDVATEGSNVYIASGNGLYVSRNSGSSFTRKSLGDGPWPNSLTGVFAFGSDVYVAGRGGLYHSSDSGNSFSHTSLTGTSEGVYAPVSAVTATTSGTYAATNSGVFKSVDSAGTWEPVGEGVGAYPTAIVADGENLYVGSSAGLHVSTDAGATFSTMTSADGLANNSVGRLALNGSTVYAAHSWYAGSWNGGLSVAHNCPSSESAPSQVTGVSALPGDSEVALSWSAPEDGGVAITDYVIEMSSDAGDTWATVTDGVSTVPASTISPLAIGTSVLFRVAAVNSVGTGTASDAVSATPLATVTFESNSGSGDIPNQSAAGSTALTSNSFTRQSYSFNGWNTAADGSGTAYADGASYAFAASATLYAQWDPVPCVPETTVVSGISILTFTSTTGCHWAAPAEVTEYDYVVVGGGGSGGKGQQYSSAGAGGSGGQVVQGRFSLVPGQSYEVIAGRGGQGFSQSGAGSTFGVLNASGGAGGVRNGLRSGVVPGGSGAGGDGVLGDGGAPVAVTMRGATEWFAAGGGGSKNYPYTPAAGGVGADGTRAGGDGQNRWFNSARVNAVTYGSGGGGGVHGGNGGRRSSTSGSGFQGVIILREVPPAPVLRSDSNGPASSPTRAVPSPGEAPPLPRGRVFVQETDLVESQPPAAPAQVPRRSTTSGATSAPLAMIGGKEQPIRAEVTGTRSASFGFGRVSVEVGVSEGRGEVGSQSGMPAVKVARDAPATVRGAGLRPNSVMKVFLPAGDGSFMELPSVQVRDDGSFEGLLSFGPSSDGKPMPIGTQYLQMAGLDEDGNETVLDMPVTIAQPPSSPELDRRSGERLALEPGESMVLNAGEPEDATFSRTADGATIGGDSWVFSIRASSSGNAEGESLALTRDMPVSFAGSGFMPGTRADVWLFSDPILLGSVNISDDGSFRADFAVDSNFVPAGGHTLQIQGVGDDGFVRAAHLGVAVEDPDAMPVAPIPGSPINWTPIWWILGAAVLAMMVLFAITASLQGRQTPARVARPAI